jgi:hypothetical protein
MTDTELIEILIEWPEAQGIQKAAIRGQLDQVKEESQRAMNIAMGSIRVMAGRVSQAIHEIEREALPDEVEVEFSLKLDFEGGAVIPMVAKTTAGGQFTVKFKWLLEKPDQVRVLIPPSGV